MLNDQFNVSSASPWRRLGAMLYDTLLCVALLMVSALPFLPFNGDDHQLHGMVLYAQRLWLLCVLIAFFVFFWCRKGRTLGMQAWGLWIQTGAGNRPSARDAFSRLLLACIPWAPGCIVWSIGFVNHHGLLAKVGLTLLVLGPINYLVAYVDPQRRAGHDRFLKTQIAFRSK